MHIDRRSLHNRHTTETRKKQGTMMVSPIIQPDEKAHEFAFVSHPLHSGFIKKHLKFTRGLPGQWVQHNISRLSPLILSDIVRSGVEAVLLFL